jgi:hypothetical protein
MGPSEKDERTETVEGKGKVKPEIRGDLRDALHRGCRDSRPAGECQLVLLQKLEASLIASHRALVALDFGAIELGTRDQSMLCRSLGLEMQRTSAPADADADARMVNSDFSQDLRSIAWKVLREARVQAALLKRSQGKLHVMVNMLAGSERNYAAPLDQNGSRICAPARKTGADRCQV